MQHPELALLDCELDIAHITIVIFKGHENLLELGARLFKTGGLLKIGDGLGVANTSDNVFALGVDKEVAVELFGSVCRVAGKGDTGS